MIDLCSGIGPFVIPIAKRGFDVIANDLNPGIFKAVSNISKSYIRYLDSVKWLRVNVEKNLKQAPDFRGKVELGKTGKSKFGKVEIMNIDGHDLIRNRLIQLSKTVNQSVIQQIEILMNLPGGALFFLSTFKGTEFLE